MKFIMVLRRPLFGLALTLILMGGCNWEQAQPLRCGDGKKAVEEACDGTDLGQRNCKALGYNGGTLGCTSACELDTSKCNNCGNALKDSGEVCDTGALGKLACKDVGYDGGTLGCKSDCSWYDTSGCYKCGDGKIAGAETCDGPDLNSKKCADLGFEGGTLKCRKDCVFDTSGCYKCGDNKVTGSDKCDGVDLVSQTCKDFNFQGGALRCKPDCSWYDTSGCYKCGDGKITGSDVCDGSALGGMTCKTMGWEGGTLGCKSDCSSLVVSGCYKCGDKKKNGKEACDAADLGGASCGSLGYVKGSVTCKPGCTLDSSKCKPHKWIWASRGGGSEQDSAYDLAVDSAGHVVVAGSYYKSATFGAHTLTAQSQWSTAFLAKLDTNGKFLWALGSNSYSSVYGQEVSLDAQNNAYVGGAYSTSAMSLGTVTLNKPLGKRDIWIAKVSSAGKVAWAASAGGKGSDYLYNLLADGSGNTYLTGQFTETATFGSHTLSSKGGFDVFIAKLDNTGTFVWAHGFGSAGNDRGWSMAVDKSGNVIVAGDFQGAMVVAGTTLAGPGVTGKDDIFMVKLDKAGAFVWAKGQGSSWNDFARGVGVDAAGNIYLLGRFGAPMTLGSTKLTPSLKYGKNPYDLFLAKLTPAGNWSWAMTGGGKYPVSAMELLVDAKGNSYILTQFDSVVTFGGISTLGFVKDGMLAKVDSMGKVLWAAKMGGPGNDVLTDIASDGKKHIYVGGACQDWATFGDTPPLSVSPYNVWDVCVAKLQVAP